MAIDRLRAEDRIMLWPDAIWPQDIGAIALLDGRDLSDPDGRFRIEAARDAVAGRLHLVPRFRQLLHEPEPGLGGPLWVDAPDFDLANHVRMAAALSAPAGEAQMLLAIEELRRRRLDRSRPLWEMWFLPGLAGGRVAVFMRTHHCLADGMAGVATLAAFLDVDHGAIASPPEPWTPAPWPATGDLLADERRRRARDRQRTVSAIAHPLRTLGKVRDAWPALRELIAEKEIPSNSLDRTAGPGRRFALVRASLDEVRATARSHGAKINDVLLAAVAGGLRELLRARGELSEGLVVRIYVPVTLRRGEVDRA
ncbi:MAG TPA: wax ester/triacylglycerol synthase domain-containing protein, partial [Patescibacteria group bacterium]|nr:wax ester/triacylglycerol synthase domain-containing protein [Patescibacteria group bacterium]